MSGGIKKNKTITTLLGLTIMKHLKYILIILMLTCLEQIYSQKISSPQEITINDFNPQLIGSTYLYYRSLITFPYRETKFEVGAIDKLFSLRFENYLRGSFNIKDSDLLLIPSNYKSKLIIKSIKYFYVDKDKICTRALKKSDLKFKETERGYLLDLSTIKRDSNFIIDLRYVFETNDKSIVNFEFEKEKKYVDAKVEIIIPEIYIYNVSYDETYLSKIIEKELLGPKIGYRGISDANTSIIGSYWVEYRKKNNRNATFIDVHCKTSLFTFTLKNDEKSNKLIDLHINLTLTSINEIKN